MDINTWLEFLHQLHCKVRNSKGIKLTGMAALNEINNFLLLKFAEDYMEQEKLGKRCNFSWLYKHYASDKRITEDKKCVAGTETNAGKLYRTIYNTNADKGCVLLDLVQNSFFEKYINNDVLRLTAYLKKPEVAETVQEIINYTYKKFENVKLDYDFFDAFGAAYEMFKTDAAANSGKNTGQHFTTGSIKKYIIDELKPQYNETFYEPCAGTGGFIHTAYSYVHHNDNQNAEKFTKNIYANECNPEIIKPLMINMLLHRIPVEHIEEKDSLSADNCRRYHNKFNMIATNPPFGMSTDITSVYPDSYWKPIQTGKKVIKDSTGQFVMHIYNSLVIGGRTGFVVDRGILNNGTGKTAWQSKLRSFLINNTNMYKVVLLPTGIFTYTNFATAIIFFKKGGKTETVEIYKGIFENVNKKEGLITDDKPIKIFTYEELTKNNYSLKIETEEKEEMKSGYVKLGDIAKIIRGKSLSKKNIINGEFPVISGCTKINLFHNETNCNGQKYIFVVRVGSAGEVFLCDLNCYLTDLAFAIETTNIKMFLYYYLKMNLKNTKFLIQTNGPPNINGDSLLSVDIPDLPLDHQREIVSLLDEQFKNYDINKLSEVIKDVPIFELLIRKQYDDFVDALYLIYRKIELDENREKLERDKKAVFRWMVNGIECKKVKLGDICNLERGKVITIAQISEGNIPVVGAGLTYMGYHNEYNREKNTITISSSGSYSGFVSFHDKQVWASDCFSVIPKDRNIFNESYIYNVLKIRQNDIYKLQHGGGQPHVNSNDVTNLQMPNISIDEQNKFINHMNEMDIYQTTNDKQLNELQTCIDVMFKSIKKMTEVVDVKKITDIVDE